MFIESGFQPSAHQALVPGPAAQAMVNQPFGPPIRRRGQSKSLLTERHSLRSIYIHAYSIGYCNEAVDSASWTSLHISKSVKFVNA